MKLFNKIIMSSEEDISLLKDGYFVDASGDDAEVEDGALVSIKEIRDHDLYANVKDLNARNITAYDSSAPIYGVVDYVGVSHGDVMGVTYRVGNKIAGTFPVAGEGTRVRMLSLGDEFYLGDENFDADPAVGSFAIPENGKTTWKIQSSIATSGLCIELEDDRDLIMGQAYEGSKLYRCRVVKL